MEETLQPQGTFFDGQTAQSWPVDIRLKPDTLLFRAIGDTQVHAWPLSEIRFEFDPRQTPSVIRAYRDGQRLDVADTKYILILRKTKPTHLKTKNFWNDVDAKDALRWGVVAVVLMVALYFVWPSVADRLAPLLPHRYIAMTGEKEMKFLSVRAHPCTGADGQKTLDDIVTRLAGPQTSPDGIAIGLYDGTEINAYAVPPNHIVIMDGLVQKLTSGDQLVAVIAHEIGHIQAGHAARMVMHNIGISLLGQLMGIDQSAMQLDKAYSRDMEREADARGLEMMQHAGISPQIMVDLFQNLEKLEGSARQTNQLNLKIFSFFASHPVTSEREAVALQAAAAYTQPRNPVLTDTQWQSLRTMCEAQKISKLESKATVGDPGAEAAMAAQYLEGKKVPLDYDKAFKLASDAAEQGDHGGEFLVGFMYLSGHGAPHDEAKAFQFISKAADGGNAIAQLYTAVMYQYGIGTAVDATKPAQLIQKAVDQKSPRTIEQVTSDIADTELALAQKYHTDKNPTHDPHEEVMLVMRAAEMGNARAQFWLSLTYLNGQGVQKDPEKAFEWMSKSATQNNLQAEQGLAAMYQSGIGTPINAEESERWHQKVLAAQGAATPTPMAGIPSTSPPASAMAPGAPMADRLVLIWAKMETPNVLSLSYQNDTQQLPNIEKIFTPEGWKNFTKALQDAHFISALEANKLEAHLRLMGEPQIVAQGAINGIYGWDITVPVTLSFSGEKPPSDIKSLLQLRVVDVPSGSDMTSLAIDRWVTAPMPAQ